MSTTLGIIASSRQQSAPLLLDTYPGAFAAYSLRKLRTAYTGAAIRVRRSSDNTETDIGFNGGGTLDTTALTTFVGAGNGFVRTWYDQSGNGRNQIQTVNANQPSIVTSGVIILVNGKPCISQDGVSGRILNLNAAINVANLSIFQVFKINDTTFQTNFGGGSNYVLFGFTSSFPSDSITVSSRFKNGVSLVTNDAPQVTTNYGNNTQILSSAFYTSATTWSSFGWGNSTSWPTIGQIQEHIWYTSSQAANRTGFETNINSFYSIYPVPPVVSDPDAQAFVNRVFAAGGSVTSTEANAVNTLTIGLKASGIWNKMRVIYPMVGASSTACSQNLKSASFTGVFSGTWTYASTGVTPGGGANLEVPLNLNTMNSINDISFGYYNRTQDLIGQVGSYGWVSIGTLPYIQFFMKYNDSNRYGYIFDSDNQGGSVIDIRGLNSITRINGTQKTMQLNNSISTFNANSSGSLYSVNFSFVRGSQGGEFQRENAFAFISDGLTNTQLSDLYISVQAFQTSLSRQV